MCCTLKKFLCCVSLEKGGLIIGWATLVVNIITSIFLITMAILLTFSYTQIGGFFDPIPFGTFLIRMIVCSLYLLYTFFVMYASILVIRATSNRNEANMIPFMVLMVVGIVISFVQVLTSGWTTGLIFALIVASIDVYLFICIYSLWDIFHKEKLNGNPGIQLQPTPAQPYLYSPQSTVYGQQSGSFHRESDIRIQEQTTYNQYNDEPISYTQAQQVSYIDNSLGGQNKKVPLN